MLGFRGASASYTAGMGGAGGGFGVAAYFAIAAATSAAIIFVMAASVQFSPKCSSNFEGPGCSGRGSLRFFRRVASGSGSSLRKPRYTITL